LILLNAAAGAATSALTDVGINDRLMKELTATLIPSSSALFVLTRCPTRGQGADAGRAEGARRQTFDGLAYARVIQERRAFFGCDMNTLVVRGVVARLAALRQK
jgi:hypothetical protein